MKKLFKQLFVFALVIAIACSGLSTVKASAAEKYTETPYVGIYMGRVLAVDGLYVFDKPDSTTKRLDGGVAHNWLVQCLAYTSNGYTKIRYYYGKESNTFVGYVHSQYLEVTKSNDKVPEKQETFTNIYGYTGIVTASALNVHSSLDFVGSNKKIFTSIKKNTKVEVVAKSKNWYKIKFLYKNKITYGYVSRSYMKVEDALKNLTLTIPKDTFNSSTKYKLKVNDATKPFELSKKIKWSSSKKSVATVSSSGAVSVKKGGTAKITAKVIVGDRSKKLTIKVNVKEFFTLQ